MGGTRARQGTRQNAPGFVKHNHQTSPSIFVRAPAVRGKRGGDRDHRMYRASTNLLLHAMVAVDVVDGLGFREKDKQTVAEHGECKRGSAEQGWLMRVVRT